MQSDGGRHIQGGRAHDQSVGNHPMSVYQVELPIPDEGPDSAAGRKGIQGRHRPGPPTNYLVLVQAPTVSEDFAPDRRVAEGHGFHPLLDPTLPDLLGMRGQNRHFVAAGNQTPRQVSNERASCVPVESGVGLGQKEDLQGGHPTPGVPSPNRCPNPGNS